MLLWRRRRRLLRWWRLLLFPHLVQECTQVVHGLVAARGLVLLRLASAVALGSLLRRAEGIARTQALGVFAMCLSRAQRLLLLRGGEGGTAASIGRWWPERAGLVVRLPGIVDTPLPGVLCHLPYIWLLWIDAAVRRHWPALQTVRQVVGFVHEPIHNPKKKRRLLQPPREHLCQESCRDAYEKRRQRRHGCGSYDQRSQKAAAEASKSSWQGPLQIAKTAASARRIERAS